MNKKKIWVVVAALVLLLAVALFVWLGGSRNAEPSDGETQAQKQPNGEDAEAENAKDTSSEGEESESAQLLEDDGDLIITIPEDEASDGF